MMQGIQSPGTSSQYNPPKGTINPFSFRRVAAGATADLNGFLASAATAIAVVVALLLLSLLA